MNGHAANSALPTVEGIKTHIAASIGEGCNAQEIARRFYYHPKYLAQLFKKDCGQTLSSFIAGQRMERAKAMLAETDESLETIAERAGFSGSQHFCKRFKLYMNMTPNAYRSLCRRG